MRRLKRTDYLGFDSTSYNLSPRKRRSRCYAKNTKNPVVVSNGTTKDNSKKSFKFRFEVPKNWKDILRIDEDTGILCGKILLRKKSLFLCIMSDLISSLLITNYWVILNIIDYTLFMKLNQT